MVSKDSYQNFDLQTSIPNRSKYRPGWQRNPTLVKMHEMYGDKNLNNGSRIVGGNEVIPHSYPHQVAMFIDGSFFCGGSLICKQLKDKGSSIKDVFSNFIFLDPPPSPCLLILLYGLMY